MRRSREEEEEEGRQVGKREREVKRGGGGQGDFREEEELGDCQLPLFIFPSCRPLSYPVSSKLNGSSVSTMQSSLEKENLLLSLQVMSSTGQRSKLHWLFCDH